MKRVTVLMCVVLARAVVSVVAAADNAKAPIKGPATGPATKPASMPSSAPATRPADAPAVRPGDDPNLPRVLILGDSISIGYTARVKEYLHGRANVHRPPVNCQHTAYGLANLAQWLGKERWDVIHFNWGIWDTHLLNAKSGGLIRNEGAADPRLVRVRHTPRQYEENLTKLLKTLKGTGATLIWASTTPVVSRKGDRLNVIPAYNKVAARVMKKNGVAIDDLCGYVISQPAKCPQTDGCHFTAAGYKNLSEQVGKAILDALAAKAKK